MPESNTIPAVQEHFDHLRKSWGSTVVARTKFKVFSGGAYSSGHMANLDSQGKGPEGAFRLGNKTMYPVDSAIKWLSKRVSDCQNGKTGE